MYIDTYIYIYICTTQPTPKFTKHTWREQVDRDVNIPPTQTRKKKQKKGVSLAVAWGRRWVLK